VSEQTKIDDGLRLFVWSGFCPDYTNGLAFAVAESIEQAQELVTKENGYEPFEWGTLQVFDFTEARAFCVSGGG
jgi:hypothetical protein